MGMKEIRSDEMGIYKFRLSDMMPNSWLYKLKGISRRSRKHHSPKKNKPNPNSPEASSSRKALDHSQFQNASPANKRTKRKTIYKPSPRLKLSSSVSSSAAAKSHTCSRNDHTECSRSCSKSIDDSSAHPSCPSDIVINMRDDDGSQLRKLEEVNGYSSSSEREDLKKEIQTQKKMVSVGRKSNAASPGIRLRVNSPKIARKKTRVSARKSISSSDSKNKGITESFAIVMSSVDPERDFRESMVDMIVENKIRETKDLEDLLACYLSLNSSEYHDIIIKAFEKTWFHLTNIGL